MESHLTRLSINNKEIILIGTAHISRTSVEEVKTVIEMENPDTVCVELDHHRYNAMMKESQWRQMDIFKIIKDKKSIFLLVNLIISNLQRKIAKQFNIRPGEEMLQAIYSADKINANLVLADRSLQITFLRIWRNIGIKGKIQLFNHIIFSFFDDEKITEETLEKLKSKDTLTNILGEFTTSFPKLKIPLIDERDQFLAQKIKEAPGEKIVAVLGAAHIPGVTVEIHKEHNLEDLTYLPPKPKITKILSWILPLMILIIIVSTFCFTPNIGMNLTYSWVFWNSTLASLGTLIALGHPVSILVSMIISPFTSLIPVLGSGWLVGLLEAFIRRPKVKDLEALSKDIFTIKGFWQNRLTRLLLVVVLTGFGSFLGSIIGGANVIRIFLKILKGS